MTSLLMVLSLLLRNWTELVMIFMEIQLDGYMRSVIMNLLVVNTRMQD